jgi:hypothetical protein
LNDRRRWRFGNARRRSCGFWSREQEQADPANDDHEGDEKDDDLTIHTQIVTQAGWWLVVGGWW